MVINLNELSEVSKLKVELETTKADLEVAEYEASSAMYLLDEIQKTCFALEKELVKDKYTKEQLEEIVTGYLRIIYLLTLEV